MYVARAFSRACRIDLPLLPEVFLSQSDGIGEEKPLVQAAEFSEKAGPMGCCFIFSESDFDPSNSIGSRNLSVLTSSMWVLQFFLFFVLSAKIQLRNLTSKFQM